ncbi:MAG: hypothetical protein KDD53_10835 [Bdellovibrionales bacterium]|nr:hypothetical protein [Bdellovibrionales bacterium]
MTQQSLLQRYEPFVCAAILGAHANTLAGGFRQYDVKVFVEVFTNWIDFSEDYASLPIQNVQIARYLQKLVDDGFARSLSGHPRPRYRLSRTGLIELISRLVGRAHFTRFEHFSFVYFIVSSYRKRIIDLVKKEGARFPYSLQLEIESLLDLDAIVERQIEFTHRELRKLDKRIEEQKKTKEFAENLIKQNVSLGELVSAVDKLFPFGINTFRRYSEILNLGTEKQVIWELTVGSVRRATEIWVPAREALALELKNLQALRGQT